MPTHVLLGSFRVDRADPIHNLIRAGRMGEPRALTDILDGIRRVLSTVSSADSDRVVVPVPGHLPGTTSPLALFAAATIAEQCGWDYAPGALQRRVAVPEAKWGGARDQGAEATSLVWVSPGGARTIVLVDDVVRTGLTLRACVEAIRSADEWRDIVAIALGTAAGLSAHDAMD